MYLTSYFTSPNQPQLLAQLRACEWGAAKFLTELLEKEQFHHTLGAGDCYFLMAGDQIAAFATLTDRDCVDAPELRPWCGFVYTFPAYRHQRIAGKLLHDASFSGSLVDLNRCGVPLIEIVSEPDIRSSAEAKAYLETIKSILQYLNISDCKMQEGSIRCDVNVSVRKKGSTEFGTRCEMKNVNSFSAAVRGIEYEAKRQIEVLEAGGTIAQETRRWDDAKGMNYTMRSKEDAQDYRYFPEPDLLSIVVPEEKIAALKASIPELPNAKIRRYVKDFGLSQVDATLIAEDLERSAMFDACIAIGTCKPKSISNWILSDIAKFTNDTGKKISETPLTPQRLTELIVQVEKGVISNSSAKKVFQIVLETGKEPLAIIEEKGMAQNSDTGFLEQLAKDVLANNEKSVNDYKNGKTNALGYLVGQCMKASKGKANPGIVKEIVTKMLSE